jgi:hypothetical protein
MPIRKSLDIKDRILVLFGLLLLFFCNSCGGSDKEIACSEKRMAGGDNFCDMREGRTYKYTSINGRIWMAENLRFGKATKNDSKYTWAEMLKLHDGFNKESYYKQIENRQGICPKGWHVPNDRELNDLVTSGIQDEFSVWSATQNSATRANVYVIKNDGTDSKINPERKSAAYAVRCVKTEDKSSLPIAPPSPTPLPKPTPVAAYKCENMDLNNNSPLSSEEKRAQEEIIISDTEYAETIYTSIFNNAPRAIRNRVTNRGSKSRKVVLEYWLNGFSDRVTQTKEIAPGGSVVFEPGKELFLKKEAFAIKNETRAILQLCAYGIEGRKVPLMEQPYSVNLLPPQFFNWRQPEYIAAFASYRMDSIATLQREIAEKIGSIVTHENDPSKLEKVVKAAYEIIAKRSWHYISGFSTAGVGQRVRYPIETMRDRSANCIEGTLLFSAILESMNIETAVILVPGHAFLAWKSKRGGNFDKFLETTLAFNINSRASYEAAAMSGGQQYEKHRKANNVESIIDVRKMWNSGIALNEVL